MKKKNIINVLLTIITLSLFLIGTFIVNESYAEIFNIAAIVVGFWLVMRVFNIKPLATKD